MSKISELSDGGSLQSTDYLIAVRSGGNVKVQADGNLSLGALTLTGLTVDTNTLHVDATNNRVGVGTTSPSRALDVQASSEQIIATFGTGNTTQARLSIADANTTTDYVGIGADTDDFTVFAGGSERIRVDDAGNVGIGTSTPGGPLEVTVASGTSGSASGFRLISADGGAYAVYPTSAVANPVWNTNVNSGEQISWSVGGGEVVRITSAGNVGIGTSSPSGNLEIATSASDTGVNLVLDGNKTSNGGIGSIIFNNNGDSVGMIRSNRASANDAADMLFYTQATGGANTERMRIDSSGNLLVGTTSVSTDPGVQIFGAGNIFTHIAGTAGADSMRFYRNSVEVGSITTTGTTTTYNTSSDARLKENIADAEDAGAKVDAIQVRQFDWKADGSHQDYGMVAQELLTVAPEAVSGDPESDDMMGVDYSKLVPMMLKEIQSLRARVAQLEGA